MTSIQYKRIANERNTFVGIVYRNATHQMMRQMNTETTAAHLELITTSNQHIQTMQDCLITIDSLLTDLVCKASDNVKNLTSQGAMLKLQDLRKKMNEKIIQANTLLITQEDNSYVVKVLTNTMNHMLSKIKPKQFRVNDLLKELIGKITNPLLNIQAITNCLKGYLEDCETFLCEAFEYHNLVVIDIQEQIDAQQDATQTTDSDFGYAVELQFEEFEPIPDYILNSEQLIKDLAVALSNQDFTLAEELHMLICQIDSAEIADM